MSLKLFHTSDLHLSRSEQGYALAVLEELVYHCRRLQADLWLLGGDVFDTHEDALALMDDVHAYLADLEGLPVVMIPGNHDLSGGRSPETLRVLAREKGPLTVLLDTPVSVFRPDGLDVEVLGVPFRGDFGGYPDWSVPARERRWRVGLLHGVVNGMTYTGESEEAEHAVIDPDLFARLNLDYAALGHIHARGERIFAACLAHYPGSPRVWRKGETGPRQASLVHLEDGGARVEAVPIEAAGEYTVLQLLVNEEGQLLDHPSPQALLSALDSAHSAQDWLRLELGGFVEDLGPVRALASTLGRRGATLFRRFEVGLEDVTEAERLRGHPLVKAFDAQWRAALQQAQSTGDDPEVALLQRARRLALERMRDYLPET